MPRPNACQASSQAILSFGVGSRQGWRCRGRQGGSPRCPNGSGPTHWSVLAPTGRAVQVGPASTRVASDEHPVADLGACCRGLSRWGQNQRLVGQAVAETAKRAHDGGPGVGVAGPARLRTFSKMRNLGLLRPSDAKNVEEQRAPCFVQGVALRAGLAERLAGEPAAEHIVVGHEFGEFFEVVVGTPSSRVSAKVSNDLGGPPSAGQVAVSVRQLASMSLARTHRRRTRA